MGKSKILVSKNNNKSKIPTNKFVALDSDFDESDDDTKKVNNMNNTKNENITETKSNEDEKLQNVNTKNENMTETKSNEDEKIQNVNTKITYASKILENSSQNDKMGNNKQTYASKISENSYQKQNDKMGHNKQTFTSKFSWGEKNNNQTKSFSYNTKKNDHNSEKTYKFHKEMKDQKESNKVPGEMKKLYIEPTEYCEEHENELGNTKFLNSSWTVWMHKANVGKDVKEWLESTYTSIYVINSIGSFWRFFNNFQMLDKVNYQYFIMRNKIKPIWEDNDNRNGSICSFRVEYGPSAMTCMSLLIMNETFMTGNEDINGISYLIKNKSILIKVWYKIGTNKVVDKIPIEFMNKLDAFIKNNDKFGKHENSSITIRHTPIEPQYALDN